jgi:hypothetical protein
MGKYIDRFYAVGFGIVPLFMSHDQRGAKGVGKAPGQLLSPGVHGTEGPAGPDFVLEGFHIPDIGIAQIAFQKKGKGNIVNGAYRGVQHGFRFIGMKLEGYDMTDPQACEGLKMNPEAYRITPGGPVGTGAGYKRLKNHYLPGLGTLQGVDTVVKLDFGFLYPQSRVIPCGTGKQNHILPPDRPGNGYFYFAVGERVDMQDIDPVDSLRDGGITKFFDKIPDYPGSVIPHGSGSGNNEFTHASLR